MNKMTTAKDKAPKHFKLPEIKTGTIDEALDQLEMATSYFELHQTIETATEVSIAARRYVMVMEDSKKRGELELKTLEVFFQDISRVRQQFERMRTSYQGKMTDGKRRKHDTHNHLQRDYDIMGYYMTLLSRQTQRIAELTTPSNDNY